MSAEAIQVDDSSVRVALGKFRLSLQQDEELTNQIGMAMLVSIRKTFRDQGSPAHSWRPLAPSTIKNNPKKYGRGHKLLIDKGTLLNSISYRSFRGGVVIGTNLKYAAVHQFGSRDRGSVGVGPRTKAQQDATVNVKEHTYDRLTASLGKGKMQILDKIGRRRIVSRAIAGPRNQMHVHVAGHMRHQNIPARPYMVFRPEDPRRIQSLVNAYIRKCRQSAGLGGE